MNESGENDGPISRAGSIRLAPSFIVHRISFIPKFRGEAFPARSLGVVPRAHCHFVSDDFSDDSLRTLTMLALVKVILTLPSSSSRSWTLSPFSSTETTVP